MGIEKNSILVTNSKSAYIKFVQNNSLILKQIPDDKYNVEVIYNLSEVNELIFELENYITYMKNVMRYLERNEKMYKDTIILCSNLTNRGISNIELPFDITGIFDS